MGQNKLVVVLFIDIKRAFDYISKTLLITHILELEINRDFSYWIKLFFIKQKLEFIINGHDNPPNNIKITIF